MSSLLHLLLIPTCFLQQGTHSMRSIRFDIAAGSATPFPIVPYCSLRTILTLYSQRRINALTFALLCILGFPNSTTSTKHRGSIKDFAVYQLNTVDPSRNSMVGLYLAPSNKDRVNLKLRIANISKRLSFPFGTNFHEQTLTLEAALVESLICVRS